MTCRSTDHTLDRLLAPDLHEAPSSILYLRRSEVQEAYHQLLSKTCVDRAFASVVADLPSVRAGFQWDKVLFLLPIR